MLLKSLDVRRTTPHGTERRVALDKRGIPNLIRVQNDLPSPAQVRKQAFLTMTMMITQTRIIVNNRKYPNGPNGAPQPEHRQVRTKATAWRDVAHFPANRLPYLKM
jgi:hypothetical protein